MIPKENGRKSEKAARDARRKGQRLRGYGAWRLPSGARLAEFALASGFLAPPLMEDDRGNHHRRKSDV